MLDHNICAGAKCKHTVSCNEGFLGDRRRTVKSKLFGNRSVVDPVVFDERWIFLVETDREIKGGSLFHCFITECCIFQRDSVVSKSAGAGSFQCLHIGQLFSFEGAGNGSSLTNADRFFFCTIENIFQYSDLIYGRGSVCHADDSGNSAFCGRQSSGMQIFFISKSRITEMNVCIDQSRSNDETVGVDHSLL